MSTTVRCLVRRDTYRDSVELMRVAAALEALSGVARAALMMATPANRQILADAGLLAGEADGAGPYATAEALRALKRGLHVFMFSDNVPLEDEVELKTLGRRKGRFVMGPDCGTAILDGVPIGFANAVRRGRVGLVGASGTGLQEVACLIDRAGEGVSQAIGVGGRDLHERVGGPMMALGIERLAADPATEAIVLVSKPPAPAVAARILDDAAGCGKSVVACFLGGDPSTIRAAGVTPARTLEEAAASAVAALTPTPIRCGRDDRDEPSRGLASPGLAPSPHLPPRGRGLG